MTDLYQNQLKKNVKFRKILIGFTAIFGLFLGILIIKNIFSYDLPQFTDHFLSVIKEGKGGGTTPGWFRFFLNVIKESKGGGTTPG